MVDLNTPKCSGMLPFIASCTAQHRWPNRLACKDTHRNDVRASADDIFDLTIFFAKRFWKDCNCFICVVRPGWSPRNFAVFERLFLLEYYIQRAKKFHQLLSFIGSFNGSTEVNSYLAWCLLCAKSYVNEEKCKQWRQQRSLYRNAML
jgi:hypothetical protein